ncbi:MAG: hypothetical protein EP330_23775 [Deltaproteobacteria bacterium]|nr:MAG: hypothetical protein EP330_23775 [Deltaproteobacteria bacterium]
MRKLALIPALLLIFPACGIDEDNFADSMARAWCSKQRECYRANYDENYDNLDDCTEDVNDSYEGVQNTAENLGCELNGDAAAEYRSELLNAECTEFNDSFWLAADDAIWDC